MTPAILDALETAWTERPDLPFVQLLIGASPLDWKTTDEEILARLRGAYPPGSPEARLVAIRELCDRADVLKPRQLARQIRAVLDGAP